VHIQQMMQTLSQPEESKAQNNSQPLNRFLRTAVMAGVESAVQLHIERGDDLNARDGNNMTPLMLSAAKNRSEICRLLLEAGADRDLLDISGRTAYEIALASGANESAAVLKLTDIPPSPSIYTHPTEPLLHRAQDTPQESESSASTENSWHEVFPFDDSDIPDATCEFDLSGWEAEEITAPPEVDPLVMEVASALQAEISNHYPIDSSEAWDDIDAFLPENASPIVLVGNAETRARLRQLLLRAIREGSVPIMEMEDLATFADQASHVEAKVLLSRVINDLGAEVDERFEYVSQGENFQVFIKPDETAEEEEAVDEAIAIIDNANSLRNEPIRIYQREIQRRKLISAEEEVELGRSMEGALNDALNALAVWPSGIEWVLSAWAQVKTGLRPLTWMSVGGLDAENEVDFSADTDSGLSLTDEDESGEYSGGALQAASDLAFSELFERLKAITAEKAQPADTREILVAMRLRRSFLLQMTDIVDPNKSPGEFRYKQAVDAYKNARDRLMEANLKLVFHLAQKYRYSGEPLDDLIQAGNIGLLNAAERYDWRRGFKFSTYATWWIRQQIGRHIGDNCRTIRVPVHIYEKLQRLRRETRMFESQFHREPALNEMAEHMSMPVTKVEALQRLIPDFMSIHEEFHDGMIAVDEHENYFSLLPEDGVFSKELGREINALLATLDNREEETIRLRFGLGAQESFTLEEVGQRFGVTRERIRQIEAKALRKLQHPARSETFAMKALGISPASEKNEMLAVDNVSALLEAFSDTNARKKPRRKRESTKTEGFSSRATSYLEEILVEASKLGIATEDGRGEGESGTVWVSLTEPIDKKHRKLARKLISYGFAFWPGKGYWK